jgi:hypothetical protein
MEHTDNMDSGVVEIVSGVFALLACFGLPVAAIAPAAVQIVSGIEKRKQEKRDRKRAKQIMEEDENVQ